jgi:hypothetical protein
VAVYVDERDTASVEDSTVAEIVATLDDQVIPGAARLWGRARDVDGDGRLTVLVTGWLARLDVEGCVRGADFDPTVRAPFGNGCDLIYLAAGLRPGAHLRTVLAHEYAHAVTAARDEEAWLDEAMAHLVEDWSGDSRSNLDHRVAEFLEAPERSSLVAAEDRLSDRMRGHGGRGGRYLFLRWCADRFGTERLLRALLAGETVGVSNLEAATGVPFPELYRGWSVELALGSRGGRGGLAARAPRLTRIEPDGPGDAWEAAGTSSHYVVVGAARSGATRIEVIAPPEAELQVSVVPLAAD